MHFAMQLCPKRCTIRPKITTVQYKYSYIAFLSLTWCWAQAVTIGKFLVEPQCRRCPRICVWSSSGMIIILNNFRYDSCVVYQQFDRRRNGYNNVRTYNKTSEIWRINDPLLNSNIFHPTSTNKKQCYASLVTNKSHGDHSSVTSVVRATRQVNGRRQTYPSHHTHTP